MKIVIKIFRMIKPYLFVLIIVGVLQITGQLGNVVSFGQAAVLKTGVLNADDDRNVQEDEEDFDFNFKAFTPDGQPLSMDSLKDKVVFFNIWATWCGPCRAEMPTIQELYAQNKNPNIVFVLLSVDQGPNANKKVKDYLAKYQYNLPVYIHNTVPSGQLAVPGVPTTYIISKAGKIVRTEIGMKNYNTERFKKFLARLAAE